MINDTVSARTNGIQVGFSLEETGNSVAESEIAIDGEPHYLAENDIYCGDARELLKRVRPASVSLSFWSPPYFVGKSYEKSLSFRDWQTLLEEVIALHFDIITPGGFLVVNIADILAFPDPSMPKSRPTM